jgi:hypothetical protein
MPRGRPRKIIKEIDAKRVQVKKGRELKATPKAGDMGRLWDARFKQLGIK